MCMDKPKINEKHKNKTINSGNFENYLKDTYGKVTLKDFKQILKIKPFLQKNFGGEGDCTLIAILTIIQFYKPELNANEIYNYIEKIAKKYLYGEKRGTFPGFNKTIIKEVFNHFNINKKVFSKYIKNIGFNEKTIINQIKANTPIILSITKDGRNCYDNHTITIIGYSLYKNENNKDILLLRVYDN